MGGMRKMEGLGNFSVSIPYRTKRETRVVENRLFLKLGDLFIRANPHCTCERERRMEAEPRTTDINLPTIQGEIIPGVRGPDGRAKSQATRVWAPIACGSGWSFWRQGLNSNGGRRAKR